MIRVAGTLAVILFWSCPAIAADEFASLFAEEFEGISLRLTDPDETLASRPRLFLSDEELSLVLRAVDPLGTDGGEVTARPTFRQRFVDWISNRSADSNVFSALARDELEPGVRVDIDTDTEEVSVEYRVGF